VGAGPGRFWAPYPCSGDSRRGVVFPKNEKTVLIKFPGLAILGRHNSSMITNAENSRPNGPSTRCLVSIFIVRINSKSFPWDVRCVPERYLFKFSAIVDGDRGRLTES